MVIRQYQTHPGGISGKESACQCRRGKRHKFDPKIPWGKKQHSGSTILAWQIPWAGEHGRLQSMRLQRVGHHWAPEHTHTQPQQTDAAGAQYMPNKRQFPIRLSRGLIPCLHFWELYAFFKLCTKNNSNSSQSSLKLFLSLDICTVNIHGWFVYPRRSLFYHNIPLYYFTVYKMFLFFFFPKTIRVHPQRRAWGQYDN